MDLQRLRTLTADAIRNGQEERERQLAAERETAARERRALELKAQGIIAQIPARAEAEARAGRSYAIIMSLSYDDHTRPRDTKEGWNVCKVEWLKGAARVVYDHCVHAGLRPTIEFWHDGGDFSGFNLLIHW